MVVPFCVKSVLNGEMIGPHEGKELALMLAGTKKCALFFDAIPDQNTIAEDIIPEKTFAPYAASHQLMRFEKDIVCNKLNAVIRVVCFTLPGEEWRAHFIMWLKEKRFQNIFVHNPEHDRMIGYLLGYAQTDINHFLSQ